MRSVNGLSLLCLNIFTLDMMGFTKQKDEEHKITLFVYLVSFWFKKKMVRYQLFLLKENKFFFFIKILLNWLQCLSRCGLGFTMIIFCKYNERKKKRNKPSNNINKSIYFFVLSNVAMVFFIFLLLFLPLVVFFF